MAIAYLVSLNVAMEKAFLAPFHLCKFADIAFDARPSLSFPDKEERGGGEDRGHQFPGQHFFFLFDVGPSCCPLPACTRVPLPTCPSVRPSVVCLSMQGISDFNLPLYPSLPVGLG